MEDQWHKFDVEKATVEMKIIMAVLTFWMVTEYRVPFNDGLWKKVTTCLMMHATKDGLKDQCQEWNAFVKHFSGVEG